MISIDTIRKLSEAFISSLKKFWSDIVNWIKKAADKIKQALNVVVEGTRTFIMRTREGLKNKSKYYSKNKLTNEWEEYVQVKQVDESEVPPEILAKVKKQELDAEVSTTEELQLEICA